MIRLVLSLLGLPLTILAAIVRTATGPLPRPGRFPYRHPVRWRRRRWF